MTSIGAAFHGPLLRTLRHRCRIAPISGLTPIALGVLLQTWPGIPLRAVGLAVGIYLALSGPAQLWHTRSALAGSTGRIVATCAAVASVALGAGCIAAGFTSTWALSVWAGTGLLIRGVARTVGATVDQTTRMPYLEAFFGIVAAAVGIILIDSPMRSVDVLAIISGYWMIGIGVLEIFGAPDESVTARHAAAHSG